MIFIVGALLLLILAVVLRNLEKHQMLSDQFDWPRNRSDVEEDQ